MTRAMIALGTAVAAAALALAIPASGASAVGCVSWDEYHNVVAGSDPSTGTHRNVVIDHFDRNPTSSDPFNSGGYEQYDQWYYQASCDGNHRYDIWYNRYVRPIDGQVFYNVGIKCWDSSTSDGFCTT